MRLHREGRRMILVWSGIAALLLTAAYFSPFLSLVAFRIIAGIFIAFLLLLLWFFRLPGRHFGADENLVYSPVDGTVVVIEKVFDSEYFHDRRVQVSIFMSPLNVHVNYVPFKGQVAYFRYHPGKYLVAFHPKSSALNERTSIVLDGGKRGGLLMRQIAGAVARRIVWYCEPGQEMQAGQEIGFIKFGSRVDLLLPEGAELLARMNQRVRAGEAIARMPSDA